MKLLRLQQPDYEMDGKWIIVTGYCGGFGAEICKHIPVSEVIDQIRSKAGPGKLVKRRGRYYWNPTAPTAARE